MRTLTKSKAQEKASARSCPALGLSREPVPGTKRLYQEEAHGHELCGQRITTEGSALRWPLHWRTPPPEYKKPELHDLLGGVKSNMNGDSAYRYP